MAERYVPNGFPLEVLTDKNETGRRLRVQALSEANQLILAGFGFVSNWVELTIATGQSRYAAFDVPAGYYLLLDLRFINTDTNDVWYHVYPEGTYTLGAATGNTATGFAKTRNLRQDSGFSQSPMARYAVTSAPTRLTDSIIDEPIWGASVVGGNSSGNLESDNTFLILEPDQQFLLQIFNGSDGVANAQVQLTYALLPVSEIPSSEV